MELRLFNYLVDRKDLIQLPVYPFERKWYDFTSAHYMDEFAELHGKDILVREALAGQVPSAGVGTCFSRRAVMALLADGDGIAFDIQSLTEDYDIGFRLRAKGMTEIFVRFPVARDAKAADARLAGPAARSARARAKPASSAFASTFPTRSRGHPAEVALDHRHRLPGLQDAPAGPNDAALNYFLWRDRKGGITNFVSFLASLVLLQLLVLWAYQTLVPDSYRFLSIFEGGRWLTLLLAATSC